MDCSRLVCTSLPIDTAASIDYIATLVHPGRWRHQRNDIQWTSVYSRRHERWGYRSNDEKRQPSTSRNNHEDATQRYLPSRYGHIINVRWPRRRSCRWLHVISICSCTIRFLQWTANCWTSTYSSTPPDLNWIRHVVHMVHRTWCRSRYRFQVDQVWQGYQSYRRWDHPLNDMPNSLRSMGIVTQKASFESQPFGERL